MLEFNGQESLIPDIRKNPLWSDSLLTFASGGFWMGSVSTQSRYTIPSPRGRNGLHENLREKLISGGRVDRRAALKPICSSVARIASEIRLLARSFFLTNHIISGVTTSRSKMGTPMAIPRIAARGSSTPPAGAPTSRLNGTLLPTSATCLRYAIPEVGTLFVARNAALPDHL